MSASPLTHPGEDDPLAARLLLSRLVGKTAGRRVCWNLCRLLEMLAPDGVEIIRPGELGGWPAGKVPYRICGLASADINRRWRDAQKGTHLLDDEILDAFVPRVLWGILEALIADGPEIAFTSMSDVLFDLAQGDEDAPADSTLSAGAINHVRQAFVSVATELNDLRRVTPTLLLVPERDGVSMFASWLSSDYPKLATMRSLRARPEQPRPFGTAAAVHPAPPPRARLGGPAAPVNRKPGALSPAAGAGAARGRHPRDAPRRAREDGRG